MGKDAYLEAIRRRVKVPILRKDFTVDPYMVYEARCLGADAVLLIAALLSDRELSEYRQMAESLGMDALVEAHDEREVTRALKSGAKILGVNNRNLKDFTVDGETVFVCGPLFHRKSLSSRKAGSMMERLLSSLQSMVSAVFSLGNSS